jgi:hypothetical protein
VRLSIGSNQTIHLRRMNSMAKANHNFIDLTGQRFTRLIAISLAGITKGRTRWNVRCDCGTNFVARQDMLKSGNTKSCGCLKIDKATKHGHSHTGGRVHSITYTSWQSMLQRCSDMRYPHYAGKGIAVCER